jgi:hypothetical protein
MHPILELQSMLVAALADDGALTGLIGEDAVFDAPPKETRPPYVTVARHDVVPRDGDLTPGHEHRVVLNAWAGEASRKAVLAIVDRVVAVGLGGLSGGLAVTLARHVRTETTIDAGTGFSRAVVELRFFTEAV